MVREVSLSQVTRTLRLLFVLVDLYYRLVFFPSIYFVLNDWPEIALYFGFLIESEMAWYICINFIGSPSVQALKHRRLLWLQCLCWHITTLNWAGPAAKSIWIVCILCSPSLAAYLHWHISMPTQPKCSLEILSPTLQAWLWQLQLFKATSPKPSCSSSSLNSSIFSSQFLN